MKRTAILGAVVLAMATAAVAAANFVSVREILTGYEEVPAVSTTGGGEFKARIHHDPLEIEWELSYSDLAGQIQQSHIHFGQTGVNGGITVFLCTNLGNGPAGTQPCPAGPATISGTIAAADVSPDIPATQNARNQGLGTGEIEELVDAIRAGATYANIHTTAWPTGEVRGQIEVSR